MKKRHKNIVASYLVLIRGNTVLLSQRKNTGYRDGEYSVIAGHLEQGETFTQTIIREAKEEAGIILDPKKIIVKHVQHCKSDNDKSERVHIYFVTSAWIERLKNVECDKCDHLKWFNFDMLPQNIVPHVYEALLHIRKGIFYSEHGW